MKTALLALSVVLNIAVVVWALHLHGQLLEARAARQVAVAEAEQAWSRAQEALGQADQLDHRARASDEKRQALAEELADLRQRIDGQAVSSPPAKVVQAAKPDEPGEAEEGIMAGLGRMMEDPKMQEAMRAQQKVVLNMMYGSLFEQLNLPDESANRLRELLVDRQMLGVRFMADVRTNPEGASALVQQAREDSNAALKELLGDEGFKTFTDYEGTLAERALVGQFRQSLGTSLENRLTADQEEALVLLMADKREELGMPGQQEREEAFFADGGAGATKMLEEYLESQSKVNAAVAAEAGEILTEAQLRQFVEFQKAQLQMQKLGIEMMRNMGKAKAQD